MTLLLRVNDGLSWVWWRLHWVGLGPKILLWVWSKKIEPRPINSGLQAFAMYNGSAGLVIFLLADPHLLECGQGDEDRSADPDGILPLRWSDDFDLHCDWS